MSYLTVEQSVQLGRPIELYLFTQGNQKWGFCSAALEVVHGLVTYSPSSIKRDRIKQSTDVFKNGLTITFPLDNKFAHQYIGFAPEEVTTVTIFRNHLTDTSNEFIIYWKGRVVGGSTNEQEIRLDCESVYTSIKRPGLRAKFEYNCRHALYGKGCLLDKENFKYVSTVNSVTGGLVVAVGGATSFADGHFSGGILKAFNGVTRFITAHTDNNITISRPLPELASGQAVTLYPGCDHLRATCKDKFNNLDRYGGFPWIPTRNPFDGSSIV
jgi:uncharacterized phage protein (TIGR02218 family)